jgi:hypothetical protein
MNKPEKFALIIGSMKSGTTYLYDLMVQHPELLGCLEKEPSFFSNAGGLESNWEKGMSYYDSLWPNWDSTKYKYALEASVNYSKVDTFPNAAERIETVTDRNFKFIYIIRNPIERVRSHMSFMTTYWRRKGTTDEDISAHALEISKYALQLDEYKSRFPEENILILLFEDFIVNPQKTVNKIFEFLEIDSFEVELNAEKNSSSDQAFLPIVHKIRNLIPVSLSFRSLLPKFVMNLLKDKELENFKLTKEEELGILEELKILFKLFLLNGNIENMYH